MAKTGSKKEMSQRHEQTIAILYGGQRSASSGAAVTDEGDVRANDDRTLFECKAKFGQLLGALPVKTTLVKQMEKIADEAWSVGLEPALALRFYCPESLLADPDGWVDLTVRLLDDDVERSSQLSVVREGAACPEEGRCH